MSFHVEQKILDILSSRNAEDVVILDVSEKTNLTSLMVIASVNSRRQMDSIAEELRKSYKGKIISIEGLDNGDWGLIDIGDVIVNVFRSEIRDIYRLEELWGEGRLAQVIGVKEIE